jgi:hypothetical protein
MAQSRLNLLRNQMKDHCSNASVNKNLVDLITLLKSYINNPSFKKQSLAVIPEQEPNAMEDSYCLLERLSTLETGTTDQINQLQHLLDRLKLTKDCHC